MRPWWLFSFAAMCSVLASVNGCGKPSNAPERGSEPSSQTDEPPPLMLDLKPSKGLPSSGNSQFYECTYLAGGKTARFRVQFIQGALFNSDPPLASAEGKFLAVAGSDDAVLLEDLKRTFEAKQPAKKSKKNAELALDAVVLGQRESRDSSGGFFANPPGDWITTTIFLPKGGDEGEVYFNFNSVLGKAEFSIKDSDYGDYVLSELAKVL
jgi:hypothetical protein